MDRKTMEEPGLISSTELPNIGDMRMSGADAEIFDGKSWIKYEGFPSAYPTVETGADAGHITISTGTATGSSGHITIGTGTATDSSGHILVSGEDGSRYAPYSNMVEIIDGELHLNGMKLPNVENFNVANEKFGETTVTITLKAEVQFKHTEDKKSEDSDEANEFMRELKSL